GAAPVGLELSAGVGVDRVDGEGLATLTPRLGLKTETLSLLLAPPLRLLLFSPAGEFGMRDRDWDQRSEWLRPLEHLAYRSSGGDLVATSSGSRGLTVGRGAIVDGYRSALLADHHRTGVHVFGRRGPLELELFGHDVTSWQVFAARMALRPFGGERPPETGIGSLTLAIDAAADRNVAEAAPSATAAVRRSSLAIAATELRLGVYRGERLAVATWLTGGVSSHGTAFGAGVEAGVTLGWLARDQRHRLLELSLAPGWADGSYLPARFDAGYEASRDLLGATLAELGEAGLGAGVRARLRLEPVAGVVLRGGLRSYPLAASVGRSLDTYEAAIAMRDLFADAPGGGLQAEFGWLRLPGGMNLLAGGASWALWPQLRAGVRVARALHQATPDATPRPTWDLGFWVVVGLPAR
ncbi:MAG: hypothetical protein H6747_14620, partial [Deltaproteobacteria bacterium]|nr:hypothetical protein [Deltaproteobacteria bacterium]